MWPSVVVMYVTLVLACRLRIHFNQPIVKRHLGVGLMPVHRLIYSDEKSAKRDDIRSDTLVSERYGLTGKPDMIFQSPAGGLTPVELKSANIGKLPYPRKNDLIQLAAYFIIVAEEYGRKPRSGRLVYADYMFVVKNTVELRLWVTRTATRMRRAITQNGRGLEAKASYAQCRHCICRETVCKKGYRK